MSHPAPELYVRVAAKSLLATDILGFDLLAVDGGDLPAFSAGAHVDVHLGDGLVRQYSLANAPSETSRYQIGVLREPASRGGSAALHDRVAVGDLLGISRPKNHFPLASGKSPSLLFAGGIGVTPILSMAAKLHADGAEFALHYCARSRDRMAYVERLSESPYADRVRMYCDDWPTEQRLDLAAVLAAAAPGSHLYVCGPGGFMDFVLGRAAAAGWDAARLHAEYFAAAAQDPATQGAFEVELASSGRVVAVPAGRSVVQALSDAGVDVPVACEKGVCGTCLTRVLGGVPDHRDAYLTPAEREAGDQFLPCCSRALTPRLVLDL